MMFDITATECSKGMYIFCSIYYLFVSFYYKAKYITPKYTSNKLDITLFFLVFVYILLSFINEDYWHYREFVINNDEFWKPSEEIYEVIANAVGRHYLLFRCVVWGLALFVFLKIVKKYNLNSNSTLYYIFTVYIIIFSYARATLAMAIFFCGFSFLFNTNTRKNRNVLIGLAIMLSSYFFHHSMLALIVLSLFCFLPLNKYLYVSLFLILPIIASIIANVFENFLGLGIGSMELVYRKLEGYSEYEAIDKSLLETVRSIWLYSLFYIPFFVSSWIILVKRKKEIPMYIKKLYSITYVIILFATSLLFLGFDNNIMFYRFLYMSMIPLTILMCYFRENVYISSCFYRRFIKYSICYIIITDVKKLLRFTPIS